MGEGRSAAVRPRGCTGVFARVSPQVGSFRLGRLFWAPRRETPRRCPLATVSTSPPPRPTDPSREAPPRAKQNGSPPVVTGAAAGKRSSAGRTRRRLLGAVPGLALAALVLGALQLADATNALPSYFVPAPAEGLAAFQPSVA